MPAGLIAAAGLVLAGCSDPMSGPVDLFHDLQGGEIAAQRPPPPGAGQPYPRLGSVPAKPPLPASSYRNGLAAQLLAERDRTERVAADTPVAPVPPPPPPQSASTPPGPPAATPGTTPETGPVPPAGAAAPGGTTAASATLDTAEAPLPGKPAAAPASVVAAPQPAPVQAGPAPGTPVSLAGASADFAAAPRMPDAPPPPATFEGVSPEPMPTTRVLPAGTKLPVGTQVYFADGSAVLGASQTQALKDFLSHRRKQGIEVVGLGGAASDTPDGQAAAVELALRRARAVAAALQAQRVPADAIRLSANAFGRGAVLKLQ